MIFKVTHNCNLNCNYCFYTNSLKDDHVKNIDINCLKETLRKASNRWQKIFVIFHGGEPLLRPIFFYQDVLEFQKTLTKKNGTIFKNSVQSNGTIYSDSISIFIKRYNIGLGISLDGNNEVHDIQRPFKKCKSGSFNKIIRNIRKFIKAGIHPGIIVVATKQVVKKPFHLYNFFKSEGLDFKINELVPENVPSEIIPSASDLELFYKRLFDSWFNDTRSPILKIRPFTSIVASFWYKEVNDCTFSSRCTQYFCVETNGDVFICGRFNHKPGFHLGNIIEESWEDLINSSIYKRFNDRREAISCVCSNCKWLPKCWGGCSACALSSRGTIMNKTIWCESRKALFEHVNQKLKSILKGGTHEYQN